jgi:hypothetical protein
MNLQMLQKEPEQELQFLITKKVLAEFMLQRDLEVASITQEGFVNNRNQ